LLKKKLNSMNIVKNQVLETSGVKPIVYDLYFEANQKRKPVVIFCHGYKGFKDWGAWHLVAEAFAEVGFFFLKFNFSHNGGTVQQPIDFPDLEAFAQNNYSKEVNDLQHVITFLKSSTEHQNEIDHTNINLIGHSRGGGIVLITAEEDPDISRVITWAGVSDYKIRFNEGSDSFLRWKKTGRMYVENGRTKQQMPHDWQFYEDFVANEERLTIKRAVSELTKPYLVVHGSNDPTVPIAEAKRLKSWNEKARLKIIDGADHVFGAKHPWDLKMLPEQLKEVVRASINFLKK